MADIFISYASVDRDRVEPLVSHIEAAGYSVWWDRQLHGGTVFSKEIESEVIKASIVIVVWSQNSLESQWVADEAEIGRRHNKLLPLRIDDIEAPIGFRQIQTIDFLNWKGQNTDSEFQILISSCGKFTTKDEPQSPARPAGPKASIAVLPFVNMSSDPEQEYFSDGISEELLNLLGKIPQIRVTARTSSFSFKGSNKTVQEIGNLLGVVHVLEGSVRKAGNRVRITAQLIETETSFHLWSDTYDRTLDDIFAIQDEISAAIVEELKEHILGEVKAPVATRSTSTDAYEQFLAGKHIINQRTQHSIEQAKDYFEKALAIDPEFLPALVGLADAHMLLADDPICYGRAPLETALSEADLVFDKAFRLAPESEEVHASRSFYFLLQNDVDQAQAHAEKALKINPNCSRAYRTLGLTLKRSSNPRALVVRTRERALHLDPASPIDLVNLIEELPVRGRIAEANSILERIKAVDPTSVFYDWGRFAVAWHCGRLKEALTIYKSSPKLLQDKQWAIGLQQTLTLLGHGSAAENMDLPSALHIYCGYGYREDANRIGEMLTGSVSSQIVRVPETSLALWHVLEGRLDEANLLLRSQEEPDPDKWGSFFDLDNACLGARLSWYVRDKLGDTEGAAFFNRKLQEFYAVSYVSHDGIHKAVNYLGACIANMLGDTQTALNEIQNQTSRFPISSYRIFFDPLLASLSEEPAFQEMKKEMTDQISSAKRAAQASGLLPPDFLNQQ